MNVKELYPKVRTFELTPSEQDGLDQKMYTLQVMLCYDEYKLRLHSHYYEYRIPIHKQTGDFIKDLILMRRDDLLFLCSLENRFMLQDSIDGVITGIKETCNELQMDINDARIQKAINRIKAIDETSFLGHIDRECNAEYFMEMVDKILQRSPLKDLSDEISTASLVVKDFVKVTAEMITKNLYPILLRELKIDSDEITRDEIRKGLSGYTMTLAQDDDPDCVIVLIGNESFRLPSMKFTNNYHLRDIQDHPSDELVDLIHQTINSAPIKDPNDDTLWRYFKWVIPNMKRVF